MLKPAVRQNAGTLSTTADAESLSIAVWPCWAYILVAVGRINQIFPALEKLPLAKVLVGVWILALFLQRRRRLSVPLLRSPVIRTELALLVLAVASLFFSIWKGQTLRFLLDSALVLAIAVFLLGKTIGNWREMRGTLICLVYAGVVLAAHGLLGYTGGRLDIDAETMYDSNDLAYVLVTVLPLCAAFALIGNGVRRMAFVALSLLLLIALFWTQSRGAVVALIVVVMGAVLFARQVASRRPRGKRRGRVIAVALLWIGIAVGVTWLVTPVDARQRIASLIELGTDYNLDAEHTTGRLNIWTRNLWSALRRPIGHGFAASPMADLHTGGRFMQLHNSFLQVLVELGFLGLFFYLRAHWTAWRDVRNAMRALAGDEQSKERIVLYAAMGLALIANMVAGFFLTMAYSTILWFLLTLMALASLEKHRSGHRFRSTDRYDG